MQDHQVFDTVIFPGAGYVEIALAVGQAVLERSDKIADHLTAPKLVLDDLSIESPLSLTREQEALVQVILTPEEEDKDSAYWVAIYSQELALDKEAGAKWRCHARGKLILLAQQQQILPQIEIEAVQQRCQERAMVGFYDRIAEQGISYGPCFQGIKRRWEGEREALVELDLGLEDTQGYHVHPALLDSSFQALVEWIIK